MHELDGMVVDVDQETSLGDRVKSGQLASTAAESVWQALEHGLNCGSEADGACSETLSTMFLELLCVTATFAAACWGGWLFSQYYFSRAGSQVLLCAHLDVVAMPQWCV